MRLARSHPHRRGIAASGIVLGSAVATGRVLGRRLLRRSLAAGEVLQRRMLGSEARYRVLETAPETVDVEVLVAPGLEPGMHVRLSAAAARAAERVGPRARAHPPMPAA
jgi:hypothetical protein